MSQISKAVFGAIAVSLTLGAVQFASGHDLAERWQAVAEAQTTGIASAINRSAKADRASVVAGSGGQTKPSRCGRRAVRNHSPGQDPPGPRPFLR
jgi:hypothetical protein